MTYSPSSAGDVSLLSMHFSQAHRTSFPVGKMVLRWSWYVCFLHQSKNTANLIQTAARNVLGELMLAGESVQIPPTIKAITDATIWSEEPHINISSIVIAQTTMISENLLSLAQEYVWWTWKQDEKVDAPKWWTDPQNASVSVPLYFLSLIFDSLPARAGEMRATALHSNRPTIKKLLTSSHKTWLVFVEKYKCSIFKV